MPEPDQTVQNGKDVSVLEQHVIVRELDLTGNPQGRHMIDLVRRLERNHEQPVDRKQKQQGYDAGADIAKRQDAGFSRWKLGDPHRASTMRLRTRVVTSVSNAITRNEIAAV